MNTSQKNFMVPLAFVGMMFFAIGFALGINSFLMPVLERSMEMSLQNPIFCLPPRLFHS